jgi:small subunit ribosomal protein S4
MSDAKCKICRRAGEKLFLKGERCYTPKCAITRHPTPPGIHGSVKKRRSSSEFGAELREKQKVRFLYGITETQFENYMEEAQARKGGILSDTVVELLERRLDNAVFRSGLAVSRSIARHLVTYGHINVNGKRASIASYRIGKGDVISIHEGDEASTLFTGLAERLKAYEPPVWVKLDKSARTAEITGMPTQESVQFIYDLQKIIQYYSR